MALPPAKFKERIEKAKQNADIKAVIDSTGARLASGDAAKGEYMYHAPYREDSSPSLKINVHRQKFIDFGRTGAEGDVIELVRLILGRGQADAMPFFEAVKWLERFAGGSTIAPKAIQPAQSQKKPSRDTSIDGQRYTLVKAEPVSKKTHPNNLAYIRDIRGIDLPVASRYLEVIQYQDHEASLDDPLRGNRYGIGGRNDSGGYELRAAMANSNFKMCLGPKDVSSFDGHPAAQIGYIFEGRFDFLTLLQITGQPHAYNPTIVLNTGRLATRAAQVIKNRYDWQHIKYWHIWQDNDDEGNRTTQAFIEELGLDDGHQFGTVNHLYEGYKDLNEFWTTAPNDVRRAQMIGQILAIAKPNKTPEIKSNVQPGNNFTPRF